MSDTEQVAHIPRSAVEHINGYSPDTDLYELCDDVQFAPEPEVEADDGRVELVCYTVLWREHNDAAVMDTHPPMEPEPVTQVLVGQRLGGAGEDRLHGESFVGWGGHLCKQDHDCPDWIAKGALREASEELSGWAGLGGPRPKVAGAIYHPVDDVSRDHVAAVYTLRVDDAEVRETDKYAGEWVPWDVSVFGRDHDEYEAWSQLLIPHLHELIR